MSILIDESTRLLIQGITGKEGRRASIAARAYHTIVVAGVTPGKGSQNIDGIPVYDSIEHAFKYHPDINATAIYVPPFAAADAIREAIAAGIPLINVMTERIPIRDTAECLALAHRHKVRIVGPASLGIISSGKGRIGVAGGDDPDAIYALGTVGVISRSGGMMNEVSWQLRRKGIGISTAIHVGGDLLIGTPYADALKLFEADPDTKGVVLFGEVGGEYECVVAEMLLKKQFTKPLVVFIGGKFAQQLPEGMTIGHAGALIEKGKGSVQEKETALRASGATVVDRYEDMAIVIKDVV
ncbi:CoA-binding protein [Candidatus Uhrbacteria bacterium]|nr:CoA-binding protein [Candidatus Uhrbacteria bacterium]